MFPLLVKKGRFWLLFNRETTKREQTVSLVRRSAISYYLSSPRSILYNVKAFWDSASRPQIILSCRLQLDVSDGKAVGQIRFDHTIEQTNALTQYVFTLCFWSTETSDWVKLRMNYIENKYIMIRPYAGFNLLMLSTTKSTSGLSSHSSLNAIRIM